MSAVVVAVLAAALFAASVVRATSQRTARRRLGLVFDAAPHSRRYRARVLVVLGLAVIGAVAFVRFAIRPHSLLIGVTLCAVGYATVVLRRMARRRRDRHRRQAETVDICDAIVAELNSGSPPVRALAQVADDWPSFRPVAHTAALGGDVAQTIRTLADDQGRESLRDLAAAWEVSARSGAGLSGVLDRLSAALRQDAEVRQEVAASLGAPRATAKVLAVLPVIGLALGTGIGGDPVAVLVDTMVGAICLAVGSLLAVAGLFWVERIADSAEMV